MANRKQSTFERLSSDRLNRQQRRELARKLTAENVWAGDRKSERDWNWSVGNEQPLCGGGAGLQSATRSGSSVVGLRTWSGWPTGSRCAALKW